jgi:hypothetical protein
VGGGGADTADCRQKSMISSLNRQVIRNHMQLLFKVSCQHLLLKYRRPAARDKVSAKHHEVATVIERVAGNVSLFCTSLV